MTIGHDQQETATRATSVNDAIADWFDDTLRIYGEMVESQRRLAVALMRAGTTGFGLAERVGETAQRLASLGDERSRPAAPPKPVPVTGGPAGSAPASPASAGTPTRQDAPGGDQAGLDGGADAARADRERDTSEDAPAEGVDRVISPEEPAVDDAVSDGTQDTDDDTGGRGGQPEADDDRADPDGDETVGGGGPADVEEVGDVEDAEDTRRRGHRHRRPDAEDTDAERGRARRAGTGRPRSSGAARTTRRVTGRDNDVARGSRSGDSGGEGSSRATRSTGGRRARNTP